MKWGVILTFEDKNIIIMYFDPKVSTFLNKKLANCALWGIPTLANTLKLNIHLNFVHPNDTHV